MTCHPGYRPRVGTGESFYADDASKSILRALRIPYQIFLPLYQNMTSRQNYICRDKRYICPSVIFFEPMPLPRRFQHKDTSHSASGIANFRYGRPPLSRGTPPVACKRGQSEERLGRTAGPCPVLGRIGCPLVFFCIKIRRGKWQSYNRVQRKEGGVILCGRSQ